MKPTPAAVATAPRVNWTDADEATLLEGALARNDHAWRAFVRRYDPLLREVVRHATEASERPLTLNEIDDVMGDFWISVAERDLRVLRSFNSARGAPLLSWLTFHVAQIAHNHAHRAAKEPRFVPLSRAKNVVDPSPIGAASFAGSIDAAIRECVQNTVKSALREELAQARRATEDAEMDRPRSAAFWSEQLGCSAESLIKRAKRGSLEATKIGARYFFTRGQIQGSRRWQRREAGGRDDD